MNNAENVRKKFDGRKVLVLLIGELQFDARVLKTCNLLKSEGADVTIACTYTGNQISLEKRDGLSVIRFPHLEDFILKKLYKIYKSKFPSSGGINSVSGNRKTTGFLKNIVKNTLIDINFNHFMSSRKKTNRLMADYFRNEKFDLVHCNDFDTLWAGGSLKECGSADKLLYDSHEYWAGMSEKGRKSNKIIMDVEAEGIKKADFVTTVNPLISEAIAGQYGLDSKPSVIMNCPVFYGGIVDTEKVNSPVKVIFQGKFQGYRGLENLIRAFAYVENAELTFSGYGPLEEGLKNLAVELNLSQKIIFRGRYSPADAVEILTGYDIGIITYEDVVKNNLYSSPNKLFDYAMAGLAVVSSDLPFINAVLKENDFGEVYRDSVTGDLSKTLNGFTSSPAKLPKYKINARKAAENMFSWERQFEKYPYNP